MTGPSFELILEAFTKVSGPPKSVGAWMTFLCPVPTHEDRHASAAIKYDAQQEKTVVRCFAGCPDHLILDSLGLGVADLFDNHGHVRVSTRTDHVAARSDQAKPVVVKKESKLGEQTGRREVVATYSYLDSDGSLVGQVIRTRTPHEFGVAKGFYQRRFDPTTQRWQLGGFDPVLYRSPEVAAAIGAGQTIWICEGEKDVDRALDLGLTATCNAMGAGKFTSAHAFQLRGARRVVIVADRDVPGRAHANDVREMITPLVGEVLLVEARDGKDFSDHIDAGHGLGDFNLVSQLDPDYDLTNVVELLPSPDAHETAEVTARTMDGQAQRLLSKSMVRSQFTNPASRVRPGLVVGRDPGTCEGMEL
ncbi:toprim domain-containing protein [Nocardia arthritidis]|uniref:Toprim domain-containing protein n=1 Tax=Nocardia arthritidis TaxID=228602 RepID=A0A6G9Y6G5_9NOCA|nr:toprim domain-containing protein [Nocardia arthritidis]QIS08801.1 toprim domain-containing protein [Nocardia arthritidis]